MMTNDQRFVIMPTILGFFTIITGAAAIQLQDACNTELKYDSKMPIHIINTELWTNTQSKFISKCRIIINGTNNSNEPEYYMIRFNLKNSDSPSKMSSSLKIIDHDADHNAADVLLNETVIQDQFIETNSMQIESSCFEINLINGSNLNEVMFGEIDSITITAMTHSVKNKCIEDTEYKCPLSNICIDASFVCDGIKSCSDGSDELQNCTIVEETNSTVQVTFIDDSSPKSYEIRRVRYLIGFIIILVTVTGIILGIWTYGKRKRKWREFLAQLDNNTDWEYEQLDDNHHPMSTTSSQTMSPIFNMNIPNENRNSLKQHESIGERMPIH